MPQPANVFQAVQHRRGAVWLDGGIAPSGWSILAWDPVETVTDGTDWPQTGRRLTEALDEGLPFSGGCIGYIGYGAGHRVESVPAEPPTPEPEVWLSRYEGGLCFRHSDATWHPAGTASFRRAAVGLLERAEPLRETGHHSVLRRRGPGADWYRGGVRRIQQLITDGDCYQVNLTRAVHLEGVLDAWHAYLRLRRLSAPALGAFLRLDTDLAVLSNSPELFLDVQGRRVRSVPIKGTQPRGVDPAQDAALRDTLAASEKDRAELMMIVDLVRNDLGRVAEPGTVRAGPRMLTAHANVHHASVEVSALLAAGEDLWSALGATFPPGSVTGAPKIRACQRIAELEHEPRGVYCGAIGYASGTHGTWSVAIRTAVTTHDRARFHVGGGIVADSDPQAEWLETVAKGSALEAAFAPTPPDPRVDEAPQPMW